MAQHKFKVGQNVRLSPANTLDHYTPRGLYQVVRMLPPDADDNQYRVKSAEDGHERVVRESQLD